MSITEIYKSSTMKGKLNQNKPLLNSLYEQPKRERGKDMPHLQIFEQNYFHEADLLFMPTDDLSKVKTELYYKPVQRKSITGLDKKYFDYIGRQFNDSKEKRDYIIYSIVKPKSNNRKSGITKGALYFQYYEKGTNPKNENDFDYTKCDILLNLKEVNFKKGNVKLPDISFNSSKGKFSYILVVVDANTKHVDAEPLEGKTPVEIEKAFNKIYSRQYLDIPFVIGLDSGSEFKNVDIINYFKKLKVRCKFALVNRHRQQALVERQNKTIGTFLTKAQTAKELKTKKTNTEWVKNLPILIKLMNENIKQKPLKDAISPYPLSTKYSENLIPLKSRVRNKLDYPINPATNKRTGSIFRSGDIKFNPKSKIVTNIILKPGYPPMYQLDNENNVAYTKQQLQILN